MSADVAKTFDVFFYKDKGLTVAGMLNIIRKTHLEWYQYNEGRGQRYWIKSFANVLYLKNICTAHTNEQLDVSLSKLYRNRYDEKGTEKEIVCGRFYNGNPANFA